MPEPRGSRINQPTPVPPPTSTSDPVTVYEVITRLEVTPQTVRNWVARRYLPDAHWTCADGTKIWDWPQLVATSPKVRNRWEELQAAALDQPLHPDDTDDLLAMMDAADQH